MLQETEIEPESWLTSPMLTEMSVRCSLRFFSFCFYWRSVVFGGRGEGFLEHPAVAPGSHGWDWRLEVAGLGSNSQLKDDMNHEIRATYPVLF